MEYGADRRFGTHPDDSAYLRDQVQPQVERSIAKHSRPYTDLIGQADSDEITSTVMEKYFKAWGREGRPDHLGGWVRTVVRATITDELRRRGVRPREVARAEAEDDPGTQLNKALQDLSTPSLVTHYKLLLLKALEEVRKDHPGDPELIYLRYEQGFTTHEIGERLGVGNETVKKRLQRATKRLRRAVKELESDPEI